MPLDGHAQTGIAPKTQSASAPHLRLQMHAVHLKAQSVGATCFSWPAVGAEEERMLHRCVGGMQEGKLLTQDSAVQGLVAGGLGVEDVVVQLAPDGPPQAVHSRLDGVAGLDGPAAACGRPGRPPRRAARARRRSPPGSPPLRAILRCMLCRLLMRPCARCMGNPLSRPMRSRRILADRLPECNTGSRHQIACRILDIVTHGKEVC